MDSISLPLAFAAGVLSFISPCVLPLVPSYVSYITGVSFDELTERVNLKGLRVVVFMNSLFFVLGFSAIFIALGASSSYFGKYLNQYQDWLRIIGGIFIIIMGLFIADVLSIKFMMRERRLHMKEKPPGYLGSFFVGTSFGAGWTPCIGPVLGSILMVASAKGSTVYGAQLLGVFSAGLAVPFLISAMAFNVFLGYSKRILKHMKLIKGISGALLILFGIILLTNNLGWLSTVFPSVTLDIFSGR